MLTPWDPLGYKVSHFRQARRLVLANAQAAGPLWEFRWGATTGICYVTRVTLRGIQNGNMTGQELRFNLTIARSFTAADTTNVASILRAGNMQKLGTSFAATKLSNFVESNSASAASGGTYTQDTDPIAIGGYSTVATPTVDGGCDDLFDYVAFHDGDQCIRLNTNEGLIVNLEAAVSGVPVFINYLEINWVEAIKP